MMKLKEVEVSKIKLFLDGKVVGYVQKFELVIDATDTAGIKVRLTQNVPEGTGTFGGNFVSKVTNGFLRSWKGNVIRLRSEGVAPDAIEEPETDEEG